MTLHGSKRRKLNHGGGSGTASNATEQICTGENYEAPDSRQPSQKSPINGDHTSQRNSATSAMHAAEYKSSIFKYQLDQLLAEVEPKYAKLTGPLNSILHQLKALIEGIEDKKPLTIAEASIDLKKNHNITIPFPDPQPSESAAYKMQYSRPSDINVVGSYAHKTITKMDNLPTIDMVVTMPSSILQEKDYLNYRYFYKRAYYLACLTAGLQASQKSTLDNAFSLRFEYFNGNTLHPIIVVVPSKGNDTNESGYAPFKIQIIPAAPACSFAESKLRPNKNAIRPTQSSSSAVPVLNPTPFYNASLQADCAYAQYLKLQHHTMRSVEGFRDACILGRIWLRQHGFGGSVSKGGFGHFEWTILIASLLRARGPKGHNILSQGYSSYQLFKATLQFLATTDLRLNPLIFDAPEDSIGHCNGPTLYDGSRGLNVLFKMTISSYTFLCDEAKLSLQMLNDAAFDHFEAIFILRKDIPYYRFDSFMRIPVPTISIETMSQDHLDRTRQISIKIYEVLKEGLNNRVQHIYVSVPGLGDWALDAEPSTFVEFITVGILFDPSNIDRLVDHGPPAEDKKKAAQFRKLWGERSELRRFKDGSILESVVWTKNNDDSVFMEIVDYLLKRHIGKPATYITKSFGTLLPGSEMRSSDFATLRKAYRILEHDIRALENLPLQLRQMSAVDSQLRMSSELSPRFGAHQYLQTPADVILQFEGSGRWPDDMVAIQRTKVALLLRIGDFLEQSTKGLVAKLGIENAEKSLYNCAFLDVMYATGAVFRLRIFNDREQTLLQRQIKDKSVDSRDREEAVAALSHFKRTYVQLPLHTQAITTHCTRFPLLSPTIRLVKMWFGTHMLSDHISDELIELIVMRVFLQPYPWRAPSSTGTGFLRTLHFLARWDWRAVPLIVDFSGSMTEANVASINTRMEAWRKIDSAMNRVVLFAATNHDSTGTAFSVGSPLKVVAARMTALARFAVSIVNDSKLELDPLALFRPDHGGYDFVLHISPKFSANRKGKKTALFRNLEIQSEDDLASVGYDPLSLFIQELKSSYTTSLVFFHNDSDNAIIGGLWNPQTTSRSFKVNMAYSTKPVQSETDGEENVELDRRAILSEITRLGGDLLTRLDVKR